MARRAPAVERCIAVLNFLAAHPQQPFNLSELARELGLNKATAHALLTTLAEAAYLTRDPDDKTYTLGPAVVAVGSAAMTGFPAVRLARPRMEELAREFDLEVVASAAIGGEIVILARAGTPRPLGVNIQPGQRLPLVPPLGTVFVAWSGDDAIDRWLSKVGPDVGEADLDRYRTAIKLVCERGYSVGVGGEGQERLIEALTEAGHETAARGEEYVLYELADAPAYVVNHIGAPVFGPGGDVVIALFLIGFRGQIPTAEVPRYAERLRGVADAVTAALRGGLA